VRGRRAEAGLIPAAQTKGAAERRSFFWASAASLDRHAGLGTRADVGLQPLAGQLVAELGPDLDRDLRQPGELDPRVDAHPVEQVHDVLGRDVARGPGRVRTTTEAAERAVDRADAELQRDGD